MTLVILGLLFGLVGLFGVMVLNMVVVDHQHVEVDPQSQHSNQAKEGCGQ